MTKERLDLFFSAEEKSGERKINRLRLSFLGVFFANELLNYHALGVVEYRLHLRSVWTMLAWGLYGTAAWYAVNRAGLYARWMKYLSAAADALFLTLTIILVEGNNGPLVPLYFVLIAVSALRYSYKSILASAVLSAMGYAAVWRWSFGNQNLVPISAYAAVINMLILALAGVLAGYVARKMRLLVLKFADSQVRRELAESALSRYVSHQVARKILESPESEALMGEGRRTHAAVLISDIRGFTTMSDGMDPAELVKLLNAYFGRMVDVVFRHDGTLDKFVGDALIVVFNDPLSQPDAECRAVACAAEMQKELAAFNGTQTASGGRTLGVGIGVHCGPVVAGNVGSSTRMDYTVMGDTVNFASRLQGKAPAGAVYVSGAVREATSGHYSYEDLGKMDFKGYSEPAAVYRLAGAAGV